MKIFTTINPNDLTNTQLEATKSWSIKYEVFSINTLEEIELIKEIYPHINFIETNDTFLYKNKKLIKLNSILDAIEKTTNGTGVSAIVNSDIILSDEVELNIKNRYLINGIFMGTRYEIDNSKKYPFIYGYDIFIFNSKYANIFKNDNYVIGMPWWDYWFPICALKNRLNIYHIKDEVIYHKTHKTNYDQNIWFDFGKNLYNDIIVNTLNSESLISTAEFYKSSGGKQMDIKKFIELKQINISII